MYKNTTDVGILYMRFLGTVSLALAMTTGQVGAGDWQPLFGRSTADLAVAGWEVEAMTGLSWPDGRQGAISFWRYEDYLVRCITFFQADAQESGDLCKYSGGDEIPQYHFAPLATSQ